MKSATRILILLFCVAGFVLSAVSLHSHYAMTATEYCDLNEMFNCDIVNRSKFSELFGIPVALMGLAGYVLLIALSLRSNRTFRLLRLLCSLGGLGFALYLAYIEEFILGTWCLLCIGSLIAIAGITALSAIELWRGRETNKLDPSPIAAE